MEKSSAEVSIMKKYDEFDQLVKQLKKKIDETHERHYSKKVLAEYNNPTNLKKMLHPDATATLTGPCGDTMRITLEIKNNRIINAYFWTDGCGATIACGSILTKMIKDKTLLEANDISSKQLIDALEGLPKEHHHCTVLAINTLQKAIKNYNNEKKLFDKK